MEYFGLWMSLKHLEDFHIHRADKSKRLYFNLTNNVYFHMYHFYQYKVLGGQFGLFIHFILKRKDLAVSSCRVDADAGQST